jgi:hypothetical protein
MVQLRRFHLNASLARARVLREYVEDQFGAIDHRHLHRLLQVALLTRREVLVEAHQIEFQLIALGLQVAQLALSDECGGVDFRAPLHLLPHHESSSGSGQLA